MGISIHLSELILREHKYKSLPNKLCTVGRPFMGYGEAQMMDMFKRNCFSPKPYRIKFDDYTTESKNSSHRGRERFISDRTFFDALGVQEVQAIDISDYEGAEIVLNLNEPLADEYENTAEAIVGGSTLDNVFDPAQYLRNMARMLKPGGRLIEVNHINNHLRPYVMPSPSWYYDYFVVNKFEDCKIYIIEHSNAVHAYGLMVGYNPDQQVGWGLIDNFDCDENYVVTAIVIAEKGEHSTFEKTPTQDSYRNEEEINKYNENLLHILENNRSYEEFIRDDIGSMNIKKHTPPRNYHYLGHFRI